MSGYPGGDLRPAPWFGGGSSAPKCLENARRSSSVISWLWNTRTSCRYQAFLTARTCASLAAARSTPRISAPTVPVGTTSISSATDISFLLLRSTATVAQLTGPFNARCRPRLPGYIIRIRRDSTREGTHADATRTPDRSDCRRSHHAHSDRFRQSLAAGHAGEFRCARRRLRLPYPHPRRPGEISVLRRPRLYPGDGAARGDGGTAPRATHKARGDRHPERLRHRQLGNALRNESTRRRRAGCRGHRRQDAGERVGRHGPGGGVRHPAQSLDRRHQRPGCRPPAAAEGARAREGPQLAHPLGDELAASEFGL